MYEQKDGVSIGASMGPVLANIIMTELERVVVDRLIQSGCIKLYARYVDDTLLLVKPEDVDSISIYRKDTHTLRNASIMIAILDGITKLRGSGH